MVPSFSEEAQYAMFAPGGPLTSLYTKTRKGLISGLFTGIHAPQSVYVSQGQTRKEATHDRLQARWFVYA